MSETYFPAISFRDLSVCYGPVCVVNKLTFDVVRGETFGLMGLNGVGKTSMIKVMLGLRAASGGSIAINGMDPSRATTRHDVAYLPERFDPPWFLSGLEFLQFSLRLYGVPFDRQKTFDLADRLALDRRALERRVQTYSKGMRQKLGLMSVFLTPCSLLVLDEPMSGLDPRARAHVKDVLRQFGTEGRTIFFSSHILFDMQELCDRVGILSGGRLVFTGTPPELLTAGGDANVEKSFLNVLDGAMAG